MDINQRPYQVALGGAGEPTMHSEFDKVLETFKSIDIVPNYTTNGMHVSDRIVDLTKKFCGGVAVTCHPHLERFWTKALDMYIEAGIKTNVHLIISDKASIDRIQYLQDRYNAKIDYYVLLPYMNYGFALNQPQTIDYTYLEQFLDDKKLKNIAFGANFYEFLCKTMKWDVSLYPPEILSKYIIMDEAMHLYKSSFAVETPVFDHHHEIYKKSL